MIIPSTVTETRTIILMWHHIINLAIEDCTWQLHWCDMLRFVNVLGCLSRFLHSAWELHRQNVTTHHKTTSIQEIAELGEFWIILTWWLCPKYIHAGEFMVNLNQFEQTFLKCCVHPHLPDKYHRMTLPVGQLLLLGSNHQPGRLSGLQECERFWMPTTIRSRISYWTCNYLQDLTKEKMVLLSCSSSWWKLPVITDCSWCMESRAFDRGHFKLWGL